MTSSAAPESGATGVAPRCRSRGGRYPARSPARSCGGGDPLPATDPGAGGAGGGGVLPGRGKRRADRAAAGDRAADAGAVEDAAGLRRRDCGAGGVAGHIPRGLQFVGTAECLRRRNGGGGGMLNVPIVAGGRVARLVPPLSMAIPAVIFCLAALAIPLATGRACDLSAAQTGSWLLAPYGIPGLLSLILTLVYRSWYYTDVRPERMQTRSLPQSAVVRQTEASKCALAGSGAAPCYAAVHLASHIPFPLGELRVPAAVVPTPPPRRFVARGSYVPNCPPMPRARASRVPARAAFPAAFAERTTPSWLRRPGFAVLVGNRREGDA